MAKKKQKVENKNFVIQAKNFLLTYKPIPTEITHDDFLEKVKQVLPGDLEIKKYVLGFEFDRENIFHAHIFLSLNKKLNKKKTQIGLNFSEIEIEVIPDYQVVKNKSDYVNLFAYPMKDKNYKSNVPLNEKEQREITVLEKLFIRSKDIGIYPALVEYKEEYPHLAMKNFSSLHNNLIKMQMVESRVNNIPVRYVPLSETNISQHSIFPIYQRFLAHVEKNPLAVPDTVWVGPSLSGKSSIAASTIAHILYIIRKLKESEAEILEVTDSDQLPQLKTDLHQGFVINESDIHQRSLKNSTKAKLHQEKNAGIRVLFGFFTFKIGNIKAFTAVDLEEHIGTQPDLQVLRRIVIFPLIPKMKINWDWKENPKILSNISVPDTVRKDVEKVHFQHDIEFIKWNCIVIKKNFPKIKLPLQELIAEGIIKDETEFDSAVEVGFFLDELDKGVRMA